jgi:hypothetical protein
MTLLGAIGLLLPVGLAAALSMTPLLVTVLLLLAPRGRARGVVFLIAYVAGMFLLTLGLTAAFVLLPERQRGRAQPLVAAGEVVVGLLLVVYGVWSFARRRSRSVGPPRWMGAVERMGPGGTVGTALLLDLRPKALLLAIAAALLVADARLKGVDLVVSVAVYAALGTSSITAPVVLSYAAPDRTAAWLRRTREWITVNGQSVTLVVAVVVGGAVLGHGLANL